LLKTIENNSEIKNPPKKKKPPKRAAFHIARACFKASGITFKRLGEKLNSHRL
jgi:hypothetical protein